MTMEPPDDGVDLEATTSNPEKIINFEQRAKAKADREAKAAERKPRGIPDDVREYLHLDSNDRPIPNVRNAIVLLRMMPELKGLCFLNQFTERFELSRSPPVFEGGGQDLDGPWPKPWSAAHIGWVQAFLQDRTRARFTKESVEGAMAAVAAQHPRHPLREWLVSLRWDGVPRLDAMLHKGFGVPRDEYHDAVSARFMIGAIMRVMEPGCQLDTMLVLEGLQGIRKSTSLKALFGEEYYSDDLPLNWADKDAPINLLGTWVMEVPELDKVLEGSHSGVAKSFISKSSDKYRSPYAKAAEKHPRQSLMVGTTNKPEWLHDETGNRRYWPVRCQFADREWFAANRVQLLAEATQRALAGEAWWLHEDSTQEEATNQQDARTVNEPWADKLLGYVAKLAEPPPAWNEPPQPPRLSGNINPDSVTIDELLREALGLGSAFIHQKAANRVAAVMREAGWTKHKRPIYPGGPNINAFWRPDPTTE